MNTTKRFYLDCPYADKDECKELGAYWDIDRRKWYVPEGADREDFRKWWPGESEEYTEAVVAEGDRFYLEVDFAQKVEVKNLGARWDTHAKKWYVREEDKMKFKDWWPPLQEVAEEAAPF